MDTKRAIGLVAPVVLVNALDNKRTLTAPFLAISSGLQAVGNLQQFILYSVHPCVNRTPRGDVIWPFGRWVSVAECDIVANLVGLEIDLKGDRRISAAILLQLVRNFTIGDCHAYVRAIVTQLPFL